jgi:hypothetical protein
VRRVGVRWRRWLIEWIVIFLWCGLLPVVVSTTYYAFKKTPDFDSALKSRPLSTSDLLWAVRVGGTSHYKSGLGFHATWFGVNPKGGDSEQRADRLWNGELLGSYQATYIARIRGTRLPRVVCVYRDVTKDGTNSYEVQDRGSGPIGSYMLYIASGSAGVLLFLKIVNVVAKRNKVTAERRNR